MAGLRSQMTGPITVGPDGTIYDEQALKDAAERMHTTGHASKLDEATKNIGPDGTVYDKDALREAAGKVNAEDNDHSDAAR